jgi:hypothetical protein
MTKISQVNYCPVRHGSAYNVSIARHYPEKSWNKAKSLPHKGFEEESATDSHGLTQKRRRQEEVANLFHSYGVNL